MASFLLGVCLIFCAVYSSLVTSTSADLHFQRELLARIEVLEKRGKEQTLTLLTQAETLQQLESKLDIQNKILAQQQQTIEDYKHKVHALERTVENLKTEIQEDIVGATPTADASNNIQLNENSPVNTGIRKENIRTNRLVVNGNGPVAFHAIITGQSKNHLGVGQNVVFTDVLINLGGGYHNQHGLFIAPRPGIYLFSTSILSYAANNHVAIYVNIMKNGKRLANAFAFGDSIHSDQGSVTVVTQLVAGDEVWVSVYGPADTSLWGDGYDSFMGCLVFPM